jgi:hypothetical protein
MDDKAIECIKLGVRLRRTQVAFFRSLDRNERAKLLVLSKKLEREFDDTAKYVLTLHESEPRPSP